MSRWLAATLSSALILAVSTSALAEPPHKLYLLSCWGCHGPGGRGIKGTAPTLIGIGNFLKVPGGRAYLIEVPGVAYSALGDAQVATVMNWVLRNFSKESLPADFTPYTEAEVARYRKTHLPHLARHRKRLLKAIAARAPAN